MTFSSKVEDYIDILCSLINDLAVLDLAMNKDQTVIPFELFQVLKITGIGKRIQYGDLFRKALSEHHPDIVGANKPGTTRN
jgi:hypothetical protein